MSEIASYLAAVDAETKAIAALAEGDLSAAIPTCPGWTMAILVDHLSGTYWWFRAWAGLEDVTERVRFFQAPTRPDDHSPQEWLATQAAETEAFFRQADPDRPCPSFLGPRTVGWWARRAMLELSVPRTDAQAARGVPVEPLTPEVAVTGIGESLSDFLPVLLLRSPALVTGTVHLHCTDTEGEWLVRLLPLDDGSGRTAAEVTNEHAKGDAAARGAASDLYLTLWGRPFADRLEVFGNPYLLTRFLALLKT